MRYDIPDQMTPFSITPEVRHNKWTFHFGGSECPKGGRNLRAVFEVFEYDETVGVAAGAPELETAPLSEGYRRLAARAKILDGDVRGGIESACKTLSRRFEEEGTKLRRFAPSETHEAISLCRDDFEDAAGSYAARLGPIEREIFIDGIREALSISSPKTVRVNALDYGYAMRVSMTTLDGRIMAGRLSTSTARELRDAMSAMLDKIDGK